MNVLSIKDTSKSYGNIEALNGLNLQVQQGEIWGILGPNGSGKTTILGIVLGIIHQDSGSFHWFEDKYGDHVRTKLGALLETPNFYPYLHADDNLAIIRHIKRSKETNFDQLLELVGLKERRKSKFSGYSLGMRQRLAIAAALVGDPEVLILDEPTNGLDPAGIADVRSIILKIASRGKTIIMASHMLDEVEKICSHVAILKKGRLLTEGLVGSILSDDMTIELQSEDLVLLEKILREMNQVNQIRRINSILEITVPKGFDSATLNRQLMDKGIVLQQLVIKKHSLETEFLEIVNK
ncbi:MAG: ATP-binding cassette domain-containing protein [Saprospiraceae bacterium]|nr:ATP-binding cassette domain-containing protein [Saprospiraceae bacterium]